MKHLLYWVVLVKLLDSLRADVIETVEAVVGQSVELPCNVTSETPGDKLHVLAWYKNGSKTAIYSRDLRDEDSSRGRSSSERYRLLQFEDHDRLSISNVRANDSGLYYCAAVFAASPTLKTHVNLHVIEPVQRMWVVHENGSRVATASAGTNASRDLGPYYVGDTVHLFCVSYGGKPQPSLIWWVENRLLKNTSTPLSEQRMRSDLQYGPLAREDHGVVLTCTSHNNDHISPLAVDVTIDMILPPELMSVRTVPEDEPGVARVRAGEPLALQCRVLGARPLPSVLWMLDNGTLSNLEQKVSMERSQRLLVSDVLLSVGREHDESHVTCCAPAHRRNVHYVCADALPLNVVYPPVLSVIAPGDLNNHTLSVVKGSSTTLKCNFDANPSIFELIWYHEDDMVTKDSKVTGSLIEPVLQLQAVTESDAGEYWCAASNAEGFTTSEPVLVDVTYPAFCEDPGTVTYGVGETESLNLTCKMTANPPPASYRWVMVNEAVNVTTMRTDQPCTTLDTQDNVLVYQRPNDTTITTIFCWGINDVVNELGTLPTTPCTYLVTDETVPRPPTHCLAVKNTLRDITVTCRKGHDGGLQQQFIFTVQSLDSQKQLMSITNLEPQFIVQEPTDENYKFIIMSTNEKGESSSIEINKQDIVDQTENVEEPAVSAVPDITTLSLSLCGGVALLALVACGLVLCAHDRGSRVDLLDSRDTVLHAFNTEESNCETCQDSDEGSEYNLRRTESFRRAISNRQHPSRNFDVRRTSSFHSARCMNDMMLDEGFGKVPKHSSSCRVHSMQNINRKRDMESLCDHLVMHLPPEDNYNVPRPVNTFYTMPRKMRQKLAKEHGDETSEITQNSDGFSLPPPPDEFSTYRAGTRISAKDMPSKTTATYATVSKKDSNKDSKTNYSNVIISPMNTVGLPTISGAQTNVYGAYPDDRHQAANRGTALTTFKSGISSHKESGF